MPHPNPSVSPLSLVRLLQTLAAAWLLLIASSTPASAQPAEDCTELVVNGGFESAGSGWSPVAGSSLFSYAATPVVGGNHSLLLGFADPVNLEAIFAVEQLIALPAESNQIELSFYYNIQVEGSASSGDQAGFVIYDAISSQAVTTQMLDLATTSTNDSWHTERLDLTAMAGSEIRLVFAVENDSEPGQVAMYVDDVSILACGRGPGSSLPTTPSSSPQSAPPSSQSDTIQSGTAQSGTIDSVDQCSCESSLYACSDFSNWSVAQACYTQCQVTAGFDIHGLDADGNGIACELELQDITPLTVTATPLMTSSVSDESGVLTSSTPAAEPTSDRLVIFPPTEPSTATTTETIPATTSVTSSITATSPTVTAATTATESMTSAGSLTDTDSVTAAEASTVAIAPAALAESAVAPVSSSALPDDPAALNSSPAAMLSSLLFSPLGFLIAGVLLIVGLLSLVFAYMAGQRRASPPPSPPHDPNNLPNE